MIKVVIGIATFKRDERLEILLESISTLVVPDNHRVQVLVIDNFGQGKAQEICSQWSRSGLITIDYHVELNPGVAHARNRAFREIPDDAEFVAFLDDDEIVDQNWLTAMLEGIEKFNADICNGPVDPVFPEHAPKWIVRGGFLHRKHRPSGEVRVTSNCGNVFFKRSIIEKVTPWFDIDFGRSGGEDSEFFQRAHQAGARIVWIDEASVSEPVENQRLNLKWILKRNFQNMNNCYRSRLKNDGSFNSHCLVGVKSMIRIAQTIVLLPLLPFGLIRREWAVRILLYATWGFAGVYALFGKKTANYG